MTPRTDPLPCHDRVPPAARRDATGAALRDALDQVLRVHERERELERRTVAATLHDEIGQLLNAARLQIAHLHRHCSDEPCLAEALDDVDTLLARANDVTRELVGSLRPPVLQLGLVPALEALRDAHRRRGLSCRLQAPQDAELDPFVAHSLHRFVDVALQCAAAPPAPALKIDLRVNGTALTLTLTAVPGPDPWLAAAERLRAIASLVMARFEHAPAADGRPRVQLRLHEGRHG